MNKNVFISILICIYKLIYLLRSNMQEKMTKNAKLICKENKILIDYLF